MPQIFVTRRIPDRGLAMLREKGYALDVSEKDGVLTKDELLSALRAKPYDGVLCLLTDPIDSAVFDAVPSAKIFANYAVGFNNIDVAAAKARGIAVTNTPGVLNNSVAEHALALMISCAKRIPEVDRFTRAGKYEGWGPMLFLGTDLRGKTLGILGAGRIGSELAKMAKAAFGMSVIYYDVKQNPAFESELGAAYYANIDDVLSRADFVSVHVPLLDSTKHLIDAERLSKMKSSAYLINTSRGPVINECSLVDALKAGTIRGAGLDVYEHEPKLVEGLAELENVVLTPHTASATDETRGAMSALAAENLIAFFEGRTPPNIVQ